MRGIDDQVCCFLGERIVFEIVFEIVFVVELKLQKLYTFMSSNKDRCAAFFYCDVNWLRPRRQSARGGV